MITIDGIDYPLWSKFVEDKSWVGGTLEEFGGALAVTTITGITLQKKDAYGDLPVFSIYGKDFNEEFRVDCGGVSEGSEKGWLNFHSICCKFRIRRAI